MESEHSAMSFTYTFGWWVFNSHSSTRGSLSQDMRCFAGSKSASPCLIGQPRTPCEQAKNITSWKKRIVSVEFGKHFSTNCERCKDCMKRTIYRGCTLRQVGVSFGMGYRIMGSGYSYLWLRQIWPWCWYLTKDVTLSLWESFLAGSYLPQGLPACNHFPVAYCPYWTSLDRNNDGFE